MPNIDTNVIIREAKLFEAGIYPDKGIEVTEEDLENIVNNFTEAPIKVVHQDTPFDGLLGSVTKVYRRGLELFGQIQFTSAAWELIKNTSKRLSIGLTKEKDNIAEVSLVDNPRVSTAAIFKTDSNFILGFSSDSVIGFSDTIASYSNLKNKITFSDLSIPEIMSLVEEYLWENNIEYSYIYTPYPEFIVTKQGEKYVKYDYSVDGKKITLSNPKNVSMKWEEDNEEPEVIVENFNSDTNLENDSNSQGEIKMSMTPDEIKKLQETNKRLMDQIARNKINQFKADGKITPANEEIAFSILSEGMDNIITFNDTRKTVSDLFEEFLAKQPKVIEFGETAKNKEDENKKSEGSETNTDIDPDKVRFMVEKLGLTEDEAKEELAKKDSALNDIYKF